MIYTIKISESKFSGVTHFCAEIQHMIIAHDNMQSKEQLY